jgi:hypothetical protein
MRSLGASVVVALLLSGAACQEPSVTGVIIGRDAGIPDTNPTGALTTNGVVMLLIDEESIDNGNEPNGFSDVDVNDQKAEVGVRDALAYFADNVGEEIDLFTGTVGDEGWHALKAIPLPWNDAGPTGNGTRNYLMAGPGLGSGNPDDDREVLLDKIPSVTPLRATGLAMLTGQTVCAVVYDGDVSINYGPLLGSLMGANLGVVAFDVGEVVERTDASTGALPRVTITIRDAADVCGGALMLFANAPEPPASGEPYDVAPPSPAPAAEFTTAP